MMDMQQIDEMRAQAHMPVSSGSVTGQVPPRMMQEDDDEDDDMAPMQKAMRVLVDSHFAKGIPEQQAFSAYARPPKTMGAPFYRNRYDGKPDTEHGYDIDTHGTVHPAIIGMLSRRTGGPNLHVETEHSLKNTSSSPSIEYTPSMDDKSPAMTADRQRTEDMAQRQRGSLFQNRYVATGPDEYEGPSIPFEDRFGEPPVGPDTRFRSPPVV